MQLEVSMAENELHKIDALCLKLYFTQENIVGWRLEKSTGSKAGELGSELFIPTSLLMELWCPEKQKP